MAHNSPRLERPVVQIPPKDHILKPFTSEADGTTDLAVDGSSVSVRFSAKFENPATRVAIVQRVIILIETATKMAPNEFGDQAALTNGLLLCAENEESQIMSCIFADGVMTNSEFALYSGTGFSGVLSVPQAGLTDAAAINITFDAMGFQLILSSGEKLVLTVQDDLSDLNAVTAFVHGYTKGGVFD